MRSAFYFGTDVGEFLFSGLNVQSLFGLIALCFVVGFMSFAFEYLRYLQTKHRQKELKLRSKQLKQLCPTESASLLAQTITNPRNPLNITLCDRALLFGTEVSLWLLLQNLGYILMLSIMVYDAWLLISAVIGGGLGYFVFGQKFMKINLQNCQIIRETFCTQICGEIGNNGESTPAIDTISSAEDGPSHENHSNTTVVTAECHA